MKKLRALFAILLAVCMLCSMAFAETEEIEATVATEEAALETISTPEVGPGNTAAPDHDQPVDPAPTAAPTPEPTKAPESSKPVVTIHDGENLDTLDLYTNLDKYQAVVVRAGTCKGDGVTAIVRFPCILGKTDKATGAVVWHEVTVKIPHVWQSEQHVASDDWGKVIVEPSCESTGVRQDVCLRCGDTRELTNGAQVIGALGHTWENEDDMRAKLVVVEEPTCLTIAGTQTLRKDGKVAFECVICGKRTATTAIDANDMKALISGSELTEAASLATVAKDYVWANKAEFQKAYANWTAHNWDAWITDTKPTCGKEGTEVRWCKRCGTKVERNTPVLTAQYELNNEMTKVLDCYHEAQVWECALCRGTVHPNLIKVRRITAHEEDPTKKESKAATCTNDGWYYFHCKHEGEEADGQEINEATVIEIYEKQYPKYKDEPITFEFYDGDNTKKIGEKRTWDADGLKIVKKEDIQLKTIKAFAAKYDKTAALAGVSHADDVTTKAGETGYYINKTDGNLSYFGHKVDALGHDWSDWELRYSVDHNGDGNEYAYWLRTCQRCGKTEEKVGATNPACEANGHKWTVVSDKAATCTEAGTKVTVCSVCGTRVTETTPAKGHTPVEIPAIPATTEKAGSTAGKKCSVCNEVLEAPVEVPMITVDNKYELDLNNVTVGSETRGTGTVKIVEGNQTAPTLYARVTWVYELADGSSFAYTAMKDVKSAEDALTFNMTSPKQPYGAKLTDVQIALVTDADADQSGTYNWLALAKK